MSFMRSRKYRRLSAGLRARLVPEKQPYKPSPKSPVSNFFVDRMRHCNGRRTVDAGLWLKKHCKSGGKIFLSMAGAGSSFQMGAAGICDLIRARKIAAISVTGANLEESMYRLLAHSHYAYIPNYQELTSREEDQLGRVGYRRITDTILPEDESVRVILPALEQLWREAEATGKYLMWHEYFFKLFELGLIKFDPTADPKECWLYEAWRHKVPIFIGGVEDSTMGNIYSFLTYDGDHPFLSRFKMKKPINPDVVHHSFRYMHRLAEWYMNNTKKHGLAFVQLGGGIAGDFPICVVPHIMKDFLFKLPQKKQRKLVRAWAGFVEIHSSPMSYGSYSGAGGKEKITWEKLTARAYYVQICGDYTIHFPALVALVLGM